MDKSIEIFSARINVNRKIRTRSSLAIVTYEEYGAILSVLIENIRHDYPDIDDSDLLWDLSKLIKKTETAEDSNHLY